MLNNDTMHPLITLAASVAVPKINNDPRNFWLGAVGVRTDGVIVSAKNGACKESLAQGSGWSFPQCHAEFRCVKKMDRGGIVYVARVARDGSLAMAKPCRDCETLLRNKGIRRAYYSIGPTEYGVMVLNN